MSFKAFLKNFVFSNNSYLYASVYLCFYLFIAVCMPVLLHSLSFIANVFIVVVFFNSVIVIDD